MCVCWLCDRPAGLRGVARTGGDPVKMFANLDELKAHTQQWAAQRYYFDCLHDGGDAWRCIAYDPNGVVRGELPCVGKPNNNDLVRLQGELALKMWQEIYGELVSDLA